MIGLSNPKAQYLSYKRDIDAAIARVMASGWYILGEEVRAFEAEFARYIGHDHAIGVGSGTEAIVVALRACGIGTGDEVITVSHTAVATVAAIKLTGATPVLVDIDQFYAIDPIKLAAAVTPKTKAVVAVHIYGQPADIEAIAKVCEQHRLTLVEDCAQSHGCRYKGQRAGSFADVSCFSFYPTKNLGAIGDGGMVTTSDAEIAKQANLLRQYGWAERYISVIDGFNSRLDEIQSAILRVKLKHLDDANDKRARLAARYLNGLEGLPLGLPLSRPETSHVFHLFVVRTKNRDGLQKHLEGLKIGTGIHYPMPIHLQPAYKDKIRVAGSMAATELAAKEILSLPIYPELETSAVDQVIDAVRSWYKR